MEKLLNDCISTLGYGCYPLQAPQNHPTPYITYTTVADVPVNVLLGECTLKNVRFQIDVWASSFSQMINIKDEVHQKLLQCDSVNAIILEIR